MKTIAAAALFLLLAFMAASAPADEDKPAAPKKKDDRHVYTEEEWIAKVKDLENVDVVGFKKQDVKTRTAAKSAVRVCVKIWDIRATKDGLSIDVVDVVPRGDAQRLSRDPIVLSAEDSEAVKDWKRWDRLAFKVEPKVTPDGAWQYTRIITRASDIDRTVNPGVEYAPAALPLAEVDSFDDFIGRFSRACASEDWKTAWKSYLHAAKIAYPASATVHEGLVDASGRAPRGPVNLVFDIVKPTAVSGYGFCDAQGHPMTSARVVVDDPQAIEALKTGARAEILLHVHGIGRFDDFAVKKGRFAVEVWFGRVK
jgi:hypothetical protein